MYFLVAVKVSWQSEAIPKTTQAKPKPTGSDSSESVRGCVTWPPKPAGRRLKQNIKKWSTYEWRESRSKCLTLLVFIPWSPVDWETRVGIFSESCIIVWLPVSIKMLQTVWNQWKISVNCWIHVLLQNMCWLTGGLSPFTGCSFLLRSCVPEMMSMQWSFAFIFLHGTEHFPSKEDFIYSSHSLTSRLRLPWWEFFKLCIMKQHKSSIATVVFQVDSHVPIFIWRCWQSAVIIAVRNECLQPENQIIQFILWHIVAVLCVLYSHFDGNVHVTSPGIYSVYTHIYVCMGTYLLISWMHVVFFLGQCLTANCSGFPPVFI